MNHDTTYQNEIVVTVNHSDIINTSTNNIKTAKDVKKAMNKIIATSTKDIMHSIKQLFIIEKAKEINAGYNNKSIAKVILDDETINHNKETKVILNILANGLTVHLNMDYNFINYAFNRFIVGDISKSTFNNIDKLTKSIQLIRKETKLINARKLLDNSENIVDVKLITK